MIVVDLLNIKVAGNKKRSEGRNMERKGRNKKAARQKLKIQKGKKKKNHLKITSSKL
jgi:hypothetical protein